MSGRATINVGSVGVRCTPRSGPRSDFRRWLAVRFSVPAAARHPPRHLHRLTPSAGGLEGGACVVTRRGRCRAHQATSEGSRIAMAHELVVHCKRAAHDVYIGRPSKWGNPFVIGRDGTREDVIAAYEAWLLEQPELLAALSDLQRAGALLPPCLKDA
jgi:hypothetical protein